MDLLGRLFIPILLASLIQIQNVLAECHITSVTSPSASALNVKWTSFTDATNYFLDLRIVNDTSVAPVVVTLPASSTQRLVQGLRPGRFYDITLKVFKFYYVVCTNSKQSYTVPATSQLTYSKAISSTTISLQWSSVTGAKNYQLVVNGTFIDDYHNITITSQSAQITGLQPATAYNCLVYSSNEAGSGARSIVKTVTTLVQPPDGVVVTATGRTTARVTWNLVQGVLLYQVKITDNNDSATTPVIKQSSTTSLDITNLEPCSSYTIGVSSINAFLEPGEPSDFIHTTSTINSVTSASVDYSCSSGMVTVTWNGVFGADSYRATAMDGNGTALTCTSESTSCQITMLRCGERYLVTVTAISDDCESTSNYSVPFQTVPCPPVGLSTYHECASNVIVFSWEATNSTNYYVATSLDTNGQVVECRTTETSCYFTGTSCGQRYKYTVYSVSGACNSGLSNPIYQSTAPCLPQNVKTSADCDSDVLISTWDSAAGALSYTVEALGNRGDKYNCSSFTNSCAIPFVNCGEVLSIWITASHDECTTDRVLGEVAETVPCIPQNFTLVESCNADSVSLDWETSNGAIFYIGMAVHSDGSSQSCMAMDTQCDIQGLRCGTTYDTYVVATNIKCNSSQTQHATATTAPCPPSSAEAMRDCAANHALVVWQKHLATGTYTAVMEDGEGTQLNCSTADNHCTIRELACGQNYSITLQHSDRGCTSSPSTPTYMESVPCAPQQLLGDVNCDTGALTVSWNITSALSLQTYTTTASTGTGQRIPCNSTATQCTVGGVECGRSYMVSVQSVQGACHSLPSQELTIEQVPCVPTDVNATHTCGESSIDVKWAASAGAKYYTALATTSGHSSNCMSNSTSCSIPSLLCGRSYNVSVAAANENCTSHQSQAVILQTASCPPASIQGSVNCSSGSASLTWDAMPIALLYMGTAVSGGGHVLNCSSSESGCQLSGLQCGTYYNFSVSATDGRCASPNSAPYRLDSGPCAPVSVATSLSCATNTLTVSWNSSAGAVAMNYTATTGAEGRTALHCSSPGSSCSIPNLQCGVRYNVTVTVSHGDCTSSSSALLSVQTAPCIPQNVTWSQSGGSNTLVASWDATPDASDYWATVTGPGGFSEVCSTASLSCTFRGLQCASQYALSVASSNRACNSSYSSAVSLTTAACDVQNVTAVPVCGSNAGLVSWVAGPGANAYTVRALGEGHQTSCHTNGTSCEVGQLMCGQVYNITVLLDGGTGYNDTSEPSATLHTAPCSPNITTTSLDCGSSSAAIYWSGVANAVEYLVNATSTNGHMASCRSANASCSLSELRCGQTYGVFVSALGEQCNSNPSATTNVITAPCPPSAVSTLYDCDTNTITIGWDDSDGSVSFVAMLKGAGHMESCQTSGTSCSVTGVQCGQNYTVAVKAVASHCNSSYSPPSEIHTVPCAPQSVNASLVCANNSAMVSWDASAGAMSYNVSAVGGDGDARGCHTYGTRCDFSGMHCGQTYDITVTPYAVNCSGVQSTAITFNTGPCPPANVSTSLECEGNIASVMWSPVASAELYIITATGPDGNTSTCSSNSTHCSFTYLQCAQTYSVSVVTVVNGCPSDPSPSVELRTALCPPMNLAGTTSCETNVLSLTWNSSPVSGATYFLFAQEEGGASTIYSASGTSLSIPGLSCGQHYNFSVSASHGHCNSCLSTPLDMYTAPCQPTHLAAQVDCGSSKAHLTWQHSGSAMFFTAEVSGEHGHMASCSSNGSSCAVRLHCGRSYNATVVAVTDSCNSTQSTPIQFDSAPCLPQNVTADLDCSANQLAVQWLEMPGSDLYTALAIGTDGYRASCNTTSTACTIHNLQCGQTYSIAVTTSAVNCSISHETDYQIESAPCKPQGSSVELECSSNMATVRWQNSSTAQTYNVTALDGQGGSWSCSSNQTSCSFSQLSCGTNYSFSVVGLTEECVSEASDSMQLLTAPCVPMSVTPLLDCNSSAVSVSWSLAPGASHYVAMVECSRSGFRSSCNSTDTQCSFSDLGCGEEYTVTVQALHGECVSAVGAPVTFNTGPCPHSNLEASLDCLTNSALVSWTPGNGSVSYNATAESPQTSHPLICSSSGSSCNISGLQCGQRYTVSVSGEGHTCPATSGESTYVDSAPCAPSNVTVTSACESDSASVSWTAADGALSYLAAAEMADGQRLVCSTNSTSCDISGLQCGQEYEVTVTAMDNSCNGTKSTSQTLRTAPCTPQVVTSHLDCQAGGLNVSWQVSVGAVGYCARVEGTGEPMMCEGGDGTSTTCYIPHLPCGHSYNLTVVALGDTCNSSRSAAQEVMAAPCPPSSISASLDCNAQVALVSWDLQGALGITYAVNVSSSEGVVFTCSTSNSNCSLSGLMCGQEYNVTVTASAHGCTSAPSATHTLTQASCSHSATLMRVEMLCQSDSALVWWDGAGEYMATAEDGGGHRLNCTSSNTSCEVSGLRCGQLYTFSVTPTESPCESQPNSTLQKYSAPCPPQNVQSSLHCDNDTASISWTPSSGAMFYIATLEQADGHQSICNTSGSSCDFSSLLCGQIYMVAVAAEGQSCNSSQIPGPPIMTAPCVPGNLMVNVSCSSNIATVTWDGSYGAVAYTVVAIGNGHSATCNSTMPTCDLSTLNCGQNYTITVSAEHVNCSSGSSPPVEIHTVPCVPSDVMASVHCMSNSMTVNWTQSAGGDTYTATLEDSNGLSTTCQSLGSQCNVSGLHCGQIYHVSVTASDAQCSSASSTDVSVHSVPCTPTGIQAIVDCNLGTATLSWQNSPGAVSYTAVAATPSLWQNMTCDTNATNCEMDKLACGEEYAVTVMAHGDTCYSSAQMPEYLITEPCVPLNLRVDYSLSTAQLYWDFTKGATNFTAEAVTPQGLNASCSTNTTNCALSGMVCGQVYNITITAHNQVCQETSEAYQLMTEPCPPQNVQSSMDCQTSTGTVSWEQSLVAVEYSVLLERQNGHSASCVTSDTYCSMDGLACGTVYSVGVKAIGSEHNSSMSSGPSLITAPCLPGNVTVEVDCEQDSAMVHWNGSAGVKNYTVTALSSEGQQAPCFTQQNQCNITGLQCGQTYNISITATNQACALTSDTGVIFQTRPCAPTSVSVEQQCGSRSATLSWRGQDGVEDYTGTATQGSNGHVVMCNSNSSSCVFPSLACGERYTFTVSGHGQLCPSNASSAVEIQTEPCQPGHVTTHVACNNDTVEFDWADSKGAMSYIISVSGCLGYMVDFNSTESQMEAILPCGQTYNVTVTPQDDRCDGPQSAPKQFKTGLCVPAHVETYVQCEAHTGSVSWSPSDGAQLYSAMATGSNGETHPCVTNDTSCTWNDLQCGEHYSVRVMASDDNCTSPPSNSSTIHMAPCIPQSLMPMFDCGSKMATLYWRASAGAQIYTVRAEAAYGPMVALSTNSTSAQFSELTCGQNYSLTLTAHNMECSSAQSTPASLMTEPCAPTEVSSSIDCVSNIAVVSWEDGNGTDYYTATLQDSNGQSQSCMSSSGQCGISTLTCGQNYSVSVTASNMQCNITTTGSSLDTAPCVPMGVSVEVDCSLNSALVSWNRSVGALSYQVTAQSSHGNSSCYSSSLSCTLANITCGANYSVQVVAMDDSCSSTPSQPVLFQTAPCAPVNVSSSDDCSTGVVLLTWDHSYGAVSYTASAQGSGGYTSSCTTTGTSCQFSDLLCGMTYDITLSAQSDQTCSSQLSSPISINTAPCIPQSLMPMFDCGSKMATLYWRASAGAQIYTVRAEAAYGPMVALSTNSTSAQFSELTCGQNYSLTLTAHNMECSSAQSTPASLMTEPCAPTEVSSSIDCVSNIAVVSWEDGNGTDYYTATLQDSNGQSQSCMSSSGQCGISTLTCGQNYSVSVTASNMQCNITTTGSSLDTAPCVPMGVSVEVDCSLNSALVSWNRSVGALSYQVTAQSSHGNSSCYSSSLSCTLANITCGANYSVQVVAMDDSCSSTPSQPVLFQTAPCAPVNVSSSDDCSTGVVLLTWDHSYGAVSYTASAQGSGGYTSSCTTTGTSCQFSDLLCGMTYDITLSAQSDQTCSSQLSSPISINTAPCIPQSLMPMFDCGSKMATLYWNASAGAQIYTVRAEAAYGPMVELSTNSTSAQFSELTCGQNYSLTLTAHNMECSSAQSTPASLMTEPCAPTEVSSSIDCVSNIAVVSWEDGNGTDYYTATLQDSNGQSQSCMSSSGQCGISTLTCGQNYSVSVTASNMQCNITTTGSSLDTAPCVPMGVSVEVDCSLNSALVSWNRSEGALSYQVTAQSSHGNSSCYSSSLSCTLANITCGANYSVQVVAIDDSCSSTPSQPVLFQTAPCAPVNVSSSDDCSTGVVLVTWDHSYGAVSYTASAQGSGGYLSSCTTTGTSCQFSDLLCGMTYDITLSAQSGQTCSSQLSSPISINTVPCEPQNASAQLDCSTRGALVSWEASDGSNAYLVQAVGANGHHINCSSSSSNCSLPSIHCGQSYNITVTVLDGVCDSVYTQFSLQSASCPPGNVQTSLQCDQGVATVSWQHSSGAMLYMVVGEAASGHRTTCNSSATSCDLEELQCGQTYNVSVYSMDNACSSMESSVTHVHTAPCPPLNVGYLLDCNSSGMEVTWDAYMDADSYMMEATPANGSTFTCNSTGTQCTISALSCGKDFSVRVISVRGECHSPPSLPINVTSAPCAPANASGHLDCVTNAAWVSWQEAPGAHGYTVLAVGEDGHNSSCTATNSNTTCSVPDLGCGNRYTFHVIATHHHCMSPPSPAIEMETAPCSLSSILASHECHADYIEVVWESSDSAHVYVATAEASDYTLLSCNSSSSCCNLTQVRCGMQYTIVVAASSDTCTSLRSPPYRISTAPCAPVAMTTKRLCESDALLVSWSPSPGAEFYELTASAGDGDVRSCNTSDSNCTLSDLHCSQAYTLTLSASHENCSSLPSAPVTSNTVPCPPESLLLAVECGNSSAVLSWGASAGAVGYTGCAQAENASMLHCHSSEASCVMEGLECGVIYNFTVQASDGQCNSSFSEPLADGLVPCAPEGLQVRLRAMKDDRQVLVASWSSVDCPDAQYLLEISGSMLGDPHMLFELYSYWTDATFFETPIPCSSTFNVTVKARSSAGTSPTSATVAGATAPCPPLAVTYTGSNVSAVVSWNSSVFAADYSVYDVSGSARAEICNTADFSCNVTGVNSDDIAVTASNSVGESTQTSVTHEILQRRRRDLGVLPAPELTVTRVMADSIRVEWTPVPGASYYKLRVREQLTARPLRPEVTSIYSEASDVIDLKPATSYCFSVLAVMDSLISSLYSEPACATTDANI